MDKKITENVSLHSYLRKVHRLRSRNYLLPRAVGIDRKGLAKMYYHLKLNKGVEIGTREGKHALILCENNPNIELTCIDPWSPEGRWNEEYQTLFYNRTVERLSPYNAKLLKKTSMEALNDFEDESLDFIHIDGNHTFDYVCQDIICWSRKVRPGGIVSAHDYINAKLVGVIKAIDAYTHCHHIDPWYVSRERKARSAFWERPEKL